MTFDDLALNDEIKALLSREGFVTPTPVQEQCIPVVLGGSDLVGVAQTGTGKTLAFLLPIFQKLKPSGEMQALIVCPTRELAQQVGKVARELGEPLGIRSVVLYGGTALAGQREELMTQPDIVVGTPGRLIDFLTSAWLRPRFTRWLVLDEADRMLDMGFIDDVITICSRVPLSRQTLLFSATMPPAIEELTERFMYHPETVRIEPKKIIATGIDHVLFEVRVRDRERALGEILDDYRGRKMLVFTATREATSEIASLLRRRGHEVVSLSSLLSQANRERALKGFRAGDFKCMVATDVAARGLDVTDIDLVVNFNLPQSAEEYVHRVGRTGRAERSGKAISLATGEDSRKVHAIEKLLGQPIPRGELQGFEKPEPGRGGDRSRSGRRRPPSGASSSRGRSRGGGGGGGRGRGGGGSRRRGGGGGRPRGGDNKDNKGDCR